MVKKMVALLVIILVSAMFLPFSIKNANASSTRVIPPIVSTQWLNTYLGITDLVVLDVRGSDAYNGGHVPGAINVPEGMWYANPPFGTATPWMEIPPEDYLLELIGNSSITSNSIVVVVGSTSGLLSPMPLALYNAAGITRVVMSLLYAGVANVAILDGGYDKWVAEGYAIETVPHTPTPTTYSGTLKKGIFVTKSYVASNVGKAIIVDARDVEVFLGFVQEPWAARPGHIPTARSFPTPWVWDVTVNATTGEASYITYKDTAFLKELAYSIVGTDMSREIIVYCGVGGYASTMFFVLSEILGYTNVKVYDGSAQEWTSDLTLPVVYEAVGSEYMKLQGDYNTLLSNYNELQSKYNKLQSDYNTLSNNYNKLQNDYNTLLNNYNNLQSDYNSLSSSRNKLQSDYNALSNSHKELQDNYSELEGNYNSLQSNYNNLQSKYNKLESDYTKLSDDYNTLKGNYDELAATTMPAYLTYTFAITTIIFLAAAVYLAIKVRTKKALA